MKISILFIFFSLFTLGAVNAEKKIRLSVMNFGTVNWLLQSIKEQKLDAKNGFEMEIQKAANPNATRLAVKGGQADVAVADWVWVSIQRNKGTNFMYLPYSSAIGSLMVDPEKGINDLRDLKGKKLGIVGGPSDKGWLLIRAVAQKKYGVALENEVEKFFGSPPLLKKKIEQGELDAIIIYWQHASQLESKGYKRLFPLDQLYDELGFKNRIPVLGFIFLEDWATQNPDLVKSFHRAYTQAQQNIKNDRAKWDSLRKFIKPNSDRHNNILYAQFVKGIPGNLEKKDIREAVKLFKIFQKYGDKKGFGNGSELDEKLFYRMN